MTEEQQESLVRMIGVQAAGMSLLDAAMALRNGEIDATAYGKVTEACIELADACKAMTFNKLVDFAEKQVQLIESLCPPPKDVTGISGKIAEVMQTLGVENKGSTEVSTEQRKKMN